MYFTLRDNTAMMTAELHAECMLLAFLSSVVVLGGSLPAALALHAEVM